MTEIAGRWTRGWLHDWLRLKGYVAFNVPRTVTALGAVLLLGVVAVHAYVLGSQPVLPTYFVAYTAVVMACCSATVVAIWLGRTQLLTRFGWFFGDLVSFALLAVYLVSRVATLPGLVALTGRWDFAPGVFAAAFASGFIAVHISVLLGINVAYPQRQQWTD